MRKSALMNRLGRRWVLLFVGVSGIAGMAQCDDEVGRLEESLKKWEKVKEECGGNYSLEVRLSSFTGASSTTTVTVRENKVVGRKLTVSGAPVPVAPGVEPPGPEVKWEEKGDELGSNGSAGLAPRTLDELYAEAKVILENEIPDDNRRGFGLDEKGLLRFCYLQDTRIADDAPMAGVRPMRIILEE